MQDRHGRLTFDLTSVRRELGDNLRAARESRKLTQAEVARWLDWSRTTLVAIEQGTQAVTVDQLYSLGEVYSLTVASFFPLHLDRGLKTAAATELGQRARKRFSATRSSKKSA